MVTAHFNAVGNNGCLAEDGQRVWKVWKVFKEEGLGEGEVMQEGKKEKKER